MALCRVLRLMLSVGLCVKSRFPRLEPFKDLFDRLRVKNAFDTPIVQNLKRAIVEHGACQKVSKTLTCTVLMRLMSPSRPSGTTQSTMVPKSRVMKSR